jgi:hypothetical protein
MQRNRMSLMAVAATMLSTGYNAAVAKLSAVINLPVQPEHDSIRRSRGLIITDHSEYRRRNRSSGKYRPAYLGVDANHPYDLLAWHKRQQEIATWNATVRQRKQERHNNRLSKMQSQARKLAQVS